ncbi:DUF4419 domain-containing protein [Rapidithrix thailandica]|uniref:DUF4419 domain-containing protein n=1 Tax=Rapidithrix thailandica TaxID=413964 RepID=A0AAW9SKI7_9BACT
MNQNSDKGVVVKAADVEINPTEFNTISGKGLLGTMTPRKMEATSLNNDPAYIKLHQEVVGTNHFLLMLQMAFNQHKPVAISPDHLWLLICQGFAEHVKLNPEYFRERFPGLEEKQTLQVQRDDFAKGKENPWEEIFPEFSRQINRIIGKDLYDNTVLTFSTSTLKETTAFEIVFMDTMSHYFDYEFVSLCGIPEIKITGTQEDYESILTALTALKQYHLDWWINRIYPLVEKIIRAINGETDRDFWNSIYKENNESGGPFVTGWISLFFPYIKAQSTKQKDQIRNPRLEGNEDFRSKLDDFPRGRSVVPFKWNYSGSNISMSFVSGFLGIRENKSDHFLSADINWVVVES